jgi:MscS family membrane protein
VNEFMAVREDLYLRIMDVVAAAGTGFAFPSQVEYVATDTAIDRERQKEVEAQVAAWRAERTLPLPDVPNDRVAELAGTLDWPPAGSPDRREKR